MAKLSAEIGHYTRDMLKIFVSDAELYQHKYLNLKRMQCLYFFSQDGLSNRIIIQKPGRLKINIIKNKLHFFIQLENVKN